jgi:prefoldin subunit 5
MELQTKQFIENVDSWIKQIRTEFNDITDCSDLVEENVGNIQHNYELIHELKEEIETLKKEIATLKLIELVNLKAKARK